MNRYRAVGLLELDEAGYVRSGIGLARARSRSALGLALEDGVHGPLQGLLALPAGVLGDLGASTFFWESTALLVVTSLAAFVAARHLAGVAAGVAAAVFVACADGLVDFSRTAHTVMPATACAAVALAALVRSDGLTRRSWSIAFGAAAGAMVLGRSMTVAFVPALAAMAGAWAWRRTPGRVAVRNGLLALAAALVVAAWWWVFRWSAVLSWLTGDGLTGFGIAGQLPRPLVPVVQAATIPLRIGIAAHVGVVAWLVLRRRTPTAPQTRSMPVWPIWAAVGIGLVALMPSSVVGTAFSFPLIPWSVVAAVVGVKRSLADGRWRVWFGVVGMVAVVAAANRTVVGLEGNAGWCPSSSPVPQLAAGEKRWTCDIGRGRDWRSAVDAVADDLLALPERDLMMVTARDWLVNANSVSVSAALRHPDADPLVLVDPPADGVEGALADVVAVVVVEDRQPVEYGLETATPDEVRSAAIARGFDLCASVELPDGRMAEVFARRC